MDTRQSSILIVDDQPDNLSTLSMILSAQGYTVRQAISGEMALRTVRVEVPDVILLDIRMPHMSGYEVCQQLKSSHTTQQIPVIFLSALDDITDKVKAFEVGGVDYITKPFQAEEVLVRLRTQLMLQAQQQQLTQQNQQLQEAKTQLQQLNHTLEQQVQERTYQLNRALEFESHLKQISDKVRDNLDEALVLQTLVKELGTWLGAWNCTAFLAPAELDGKPLIYEYGSAIPPNLLVSSTAAPTNTDEAIDVSPNPNGLSTLSCAIGDQQHTLGELRVYKNLEERFDDLEVRLVNQVANQCAIAIRQARLYQTAQAQVQELERLNRLKDDFISTLSHELRTPMASIKMSLQLLEVMLHQPNVLHPNVPTKTRDRLQDCLRILKEESDREINLIADLLTLQRLTVGTQSAMLGIVVLQDWVPAVAAPFVAKFTAHHQTWQLDISPDLPVLTTDLFILHRILVELLTNAYKFTPAHEQIRLSIRAAKPAIAAPTFLASNQHLQINLCNTGTEIPQHELQNVFDQFYRLPSRDPWKHSGTGLGLALVKKLAIHLGGTVRAESNSSGTSFIVELPFHPADRSGSQAVSTLKSKPGLGEES